ncbi:ribonuclease H-like domain-containing protein [Cladochytrium replicatum]|nr:ribonuclease H-like domain-containing protein [Cladochytrium replicatum]
MPNQRFVGKLQVKSLADLIKGTAVRPSERFQKIASGRAFPLGIKHWSVLVFADEQPVPRPAVDNFVVTIARECQIKNMEVAGKPEVLYPPRGVAVRDALIKANQKSWANGEGSSKNRADLILVILSEKKLYEQINRVAKFEMGLITQCALAEQASRSTRHMVPIWHSRSLQSSAGSTILVPESIQEIYANNGLLPTHVIFYGDGVSEGQYGPVVFDEVPEQGVAETNRSGNVPAGTVVDKGVTHPTEFDFFLVSQAGLQGTSKPSHYHVLYDENVFTPDEMEVITFRLCFFLPDVQNRSAAYQPHDMRTLSQRGLVFHLGEELERRERENRERRGIDMAFQRSARFCG